MRSFFSPFRSFCRPKWQISYHEYQRSIFERGWCFDVGWRKKKSSYGAACHLPFPLNFELFYWITFEPIRSNVSYCDRTDWHVKFPITNKRYVIILTNFVVEYNLQLCKLTLLAQITKSSAYHFRIRALTGQTINIVGLLGYSHLTKLQSTNYH